jgi:4,5:9,10-diseco-3-hydroxy-5,9,17-trioxoandrosta-1(10),2-diene-4-oate hydrolase
MTTPTGPTVPAVPEGAYAEIGDDLRVHYHEQGEGEPVLLLHGSGPGASGWSNFKQNLPALARAGFRALVPDTLGFGYSSKPETVDYHLDYLVRATRRFLDAVGIERCAVIGNSHGGAMAIQLALSHPERVSKLVLMAPGGLESRDVYMKMPGIRAMVKAVLGDEGVTADNLRGLFALQLHDPSLMTDRLLEERLQIAKLQPKRVLSSMVVPVLASRLGELAMPVLGFWGANDRFCPVSGATTLVDKVADCRVTMLSRCGHWVMVERQHVFDRATAEFLAA